MGFSMQPYGIQAMLKEGHKHLSGLDEAVLKNIDACKQLSTITRTSLGPNGMNKMVINHLDKLFVTNDAATIVNELEVQHPAAKILVLAGKAQQEEIGDGANLTISFAGELLQNAEELIRTGLHPSEIISGYTKASGKAIEILEELVEKGSENMDVRSKEQVVTRMKAAVASKQHGQEDILCSLIADACIQVCPKNPANFDVDNVRVAKLVGGGLHDCTVVRGMVLKCDAVGSIKRVEKAKVAVFASGVDTSATETKGTVLIHSAEQLENYAKTEEAKVEELIKAVVDSGAKVIVSGGAVGEMALHFCERYKLMVLKISSKFELRRFCRTTGTAALLKLSQPKADDLGFIDSVSVEEIGGSRVTVVRSEEGGNRVAATPYYIHRGVGGSSSGSVTHTGIAGFHSQPGFRPLSNPQVQLQSNVGSTFTGEPRNVSFPHGIDMGVSSGTPPGEPLKKKRGRPRKYAPDGQVSLGLLPMPDKRKPSSGSDTSGQKRNRGRPPGTGRKQQLATLGEWMNSSAGLAFAPHFVTVGIGEDIVTKVLSFSQQRPRAVCILSGSGTVSSVTLREPASSTPTLTYEGHFEILCLSGSYMLAEDGGPHSRTGGISASLSTPDGHVIGGGVAKLIASSLVQLVVCSFVYRGSKTKNKQLASPKDSKDSIPQLSNKSAMPTFAPSTQNFTPPSMSVWPGSGPADLRNPHMDIDLTRG